MMHVVVCYVDGKQLQGPPEEWPRWRGDGVDWVRIGDYERSGHSLYWLYQEGDSWVFGAGSPYWTPQPPEIVFSASGITERGTRDPAYGFPDLKHSAVKLGWWRPKRAT